MVLKLALNCGSIDDCIDLANCILSYKGVNASLIKYEVRRGCLEIFIFGTNIEKTSVKAAVLKAYREWKHITLWRKEGKEIEIEYLIKIVGKPFITDALNEVLNIIGIKAEISNKRLISSANWDTIYSIATKLAHALEELIRKYPKASHSAKALVTSYVALTDVNVNEAINRLREINAITINGHRVLVKKGWRHLLRELLERI